jgi:hypothetical protein
MLNPQQLLEPRTKIVVLKELPHKVSRLFKKLKWFEDREPDEMPEYIRHVKKGKTIRYRDYLKDGKIIYDREVWNLDECIPVEKPFYFD